MHYRMYLLFYRSSTVLVVNGPLVVEGNYISTVLFAVQWSNCWTERNITRVDLSSPGRKDITLSKQVEERKIENVKVWASKTPTFIDK